MSAPVVLRDLSAWEPRTHDDDGWLQRLSRHLDDHDHVLHLTGGPRDDDEDEPPLLRDSDGTWWAGRFVGELRFEHRELRIEPRLGIDVIGTWLAHALNVTIVPRSAGPAGSGPIIVQLVDRVWSAAVAEAARHGGPRLRRSTRHDTVYVRGRLDAAGTARHRVARRPLVATTRSERDLDNPVAKVLVLADQVLRSLLGSTPNWRPTRCGELLAHLRGSVGSRPAMPHAAELRRVRYTPITRGFQSVARLSYEIARRRGTLTSATSADAEGVLIDVAELWELFLVHCARRAFGAARVEHGTSARDGTHLLHAVSNPGRHLGRLKPDILVREPNGALAAVIDAKYKRLRGWRGSPSGVDRGDLYQLVAYLGGHDVPIGMLAYPPHPDDRAIASDEGPWEMAGGQRMAFARIPATATEASDAFLRLVRAPAAGQPTVGAA